MIALTTPHVDAEVLRIRRRYNRERTNLGEDFFRSFYERIEFICEYSNTGTSLGSGVRRIKITRFPYHLYFRIDSNVIWVVAIIHNKQDR